MHLVNVSLDNYLYYSIKINRRLCFVDCIGILYVSIENELANVN